MLWLGQHLKQRSGDRGLGNKLDRVGPEVLHPAWLTEGSPIARGVLSQRSRRNFGDQLAVLQDPDLSNIDHLAHDRRLDLPSVRHLEYLLEMIGMDKRHHALLRLRHQ